MHEQEGTIQLSAAAKRPTTTGAVLSRQNTSSEQPSPPNMAAANFVAATSMGEGCTLNGTAVAAVLIDQ